MSGAAEQFVDADDIVSSAYNDALESSSSVGPIYWCRTCSIHVVPRGRRVTTCPECEGENIIPLGNVGLSSASATGLRYRGRQRGASESDLSRLGGGNDNNWHLSPPSLSGVLMGHNPSRSNNALFMPTARIPLFGTLGHDWEDISNDRSFLRNNDHEQDGRLGYRSSVEGRNSPFLFRPWGAHSPPIYTRSPEPTWQQFVQEMLQSILRRGDRAISARPLDHVSDPGDYLDDSRGFDRLLSELAENDNEDHGPPPASKSAVKKLPFIAIEQQHIDDDSATCPVCKDRMELGEMAKELPCQHLYHESCILPWLDFRNSCPVCRFELPTDDADYEARKHAVTGNSRSMIGQERGEASDMISAQEGADESRRFYPNLAVEEIEEGFEAHPVEQSRRYEGWRRGWLWFAARPLLSLMGIVLAFTLGHRLIVAQEPIGNQIATELSSNPAPNTVGDEFYNCP